MTDYGRDWAAQETARRRESLARNTEVSRRQLAASVELLEVLHAKALAVPAPGAGADAIAEARGILADLAYLYETEYRAYLAKPIACPSGITLEPGHVYNLTARGDYGAKRPTRYLRATVDHVSGEPGDELVGTRTVWVSRTPSGYPKRDSIGLGRIVEAEEVR